MDRLTKEKEMQLVALGYHWHGVYECYMNDRNDNDTLWMNGYKDEWVSLWHDQYGEENSVTFNNFNEMLEYFTPA